MLRLTLLIATLAMSTTTAPAADNYWVFTGGYTGGKAGGEGIMVGTLDAKTGALSKPELAAKVANPSFLAVAPNGKTLYAVGETDGPAGGGVFAYRIDPATGKLTELNKLMSGGNAPCHIVTDAAGKFAVASNYSGGSFSVYSLNVDGSLNERTAFVQLTGKSVNPGNQEAPHAHCAAFDPTNEFILLCDLGTDKLRIYKLDRATGAVAPHTLPFVAFPPGTGPRHIDLTTDGKRAYVNGEINSTVNVVSLDLAAGKGQVVQTLSTLPQPTPGNSTAECRLHPNGKFVYVSNRGHNSIAAFGNSAAELTTLDRATKGIDVPRNFNIDPSGKWMLVANQSGNDVAVFTIGDDGVPKPTGTTVKTLAPVCIKFLAK